jgi:acyl-phosphate glycerol 3-phosphate acyltransferase
MTEMLIPILAVALSYLAGSIPAGLWLGLLLRGIDIRDHGSRNIGATNTLRVLGKGPGIAALIFDIAKGLAAVLLFARIGNWEYLPLACGIAAILGHVFPIYLRFRGGKGVATSAGVFFGLAPAPMLVAAAAFFTVAAATRMVSAGSITAALIMAGCVIALPFSLPLKLFTALAALLVLVKHRTNIGRILRGSENRLGGDTSPTWKQHLVRGVIVLIGGALLFAAFVPFFLPDMAQQELDAELRASVENRNFAELSDGVTCYEWGGPEDGPKVVLVHGFTSPSFIWDPQFDALTAAGFRVLRYDLYGRGYSSRPKIRYTADLFDRQLVELLDAQGVKEPVDVAGLSMGGAITIHFVDRHPERVRRFALLAPAGFSLHVPLKYRLLHMTGVGEWLMAAIGDRTLLKSMSRQMTAFPEKAAEFRKRYKPQMEIEGYKYAILSTLRHNPLLDLGDVFRRVGEMDIPGLLLWGTADHVVPFAHHKRVEACIPHIRFHAVEGGSHTMNYEEPGKVNPILIAFLKS